MALEGAFSRQSRNQLKEKPLTDAALLRVERFQARRIAERFYDPPCRVVAPEAALQLTPARLLRFIQQRLKERAVTAHLLYHLRAVERREARRRQDSEQEIAS